MPAVVISQGNPRPCQPAGFANSSSRSHHAVTHHPNFGEQPEVHHGLVQRTRDGLVTIVLVRFAKTLRAVDELEQLLLLFPLWAPSMMRHGE